MGVTHTHVTLTDVGTKETFKNSFQSKKTCVIILLRRQPKYYFATATTCSSLTVSSKGCKKAACVGVGVGVGGGAELQTRHGAG